MHAFCFISQDPVKASTLAKYLGFPLDSAEVSTLTADSSLGIDTIRELTRFLITKPSKPYKLGYLPEAHLLTLPAQHALLKTLEEPPEYASLVLVIPNREALLPAILSRTAIIYLHPKTSAIILDESAVSFYRKLEASPIAHRIQLCEVYNTKAKVTELLVTGSYLYQKELSTNPKAAIICKLIHKSLSYLQANVQPLLALEHVALHIPFAPTSLLR